MSLSISIYIYIYLYLHTRLPIPPTSTPHTPKPSNGGPLWPHLLPRLLAEAAAGQGRVPHVQVCMHVHVYMCRGCLPVYVYTLLYRYVYLTLHV